MLKSKFLAASLLSAALLGLGASTQAQVFVKPEGAVKYRQGAMAVMGAHFAAIGAVATGKAEYNKDAVLKSAEIVALMSTLSWKGFDVYQQGGEAHPDVWKKRDLFDKAAAKLDEESAKLLTAAQKGDLATIKAAFSSTAQTCKSCHQSFKN